MNRDFGLPLIPRLNSSPDGGRCRKTGLLQLRREEERCYCAGLDEMISCVSLVDGDERKEEVQAADALESFILPSNTLRKCTTPTPRRTFTSAPTISPPLHILRQRACHANISRSEQKRVDCVIDCLQIPRLEKATGVSEYKSGARRLITPRKTHPINIQIPSLEKAVHANGHISGARRLKPRKRVLRHSMIPTPKRQACEPSMSTIRPPASMGRIHHVDLCSDPTVTPS